MHYYKLLISYDGTQYAGWQTQNNALSIQMVIEKALLTACRESCTLIGSGRTDAGVHARAQVAHFSLSTPIVLLKLQASLNGLIPPDIRILEVIEVPETFHAQYSALGKVYAYHIFLKKVLSPFERFYGWHISYPLNLEAMKRAAALLVGTHDFTSFATHAFEGSASKNPIRTLSRIEFFEEEGQLRLEFEGNGFLYKMVRNLVGTLVDVGTGKFSPEAILGILHAKDRREAGQTAPAQGLFLVKVHYPDHAIG